MRIAIQPLKTVASSAGSFTTFEKNHDHVNTGYACDLCTFKFFLDSSFHMIFFFNAYSLFLLQQHYELWFTQTQSASLALCAESVYKELEKCG